MHTPGKSKKSILIYSYRSIRAYYVYRFMCKKIIPYIYLWLYLYNQDIYKKAKKEIVSKP